MGPGWGWGWAREAHQNQRTAGNRLAIVLITPKASELLPKVASSFCGGSCHRELYACLVSEPRSCFRSTATMARFRKPPPPSISWRAWLSSPGRTWCSSPSLAKPLSTGRFSPWCARRRICLGDSQFQKLSTPDLPQLEGMSLLNDWGAFVGSGSCQEASGAVAAPAPAASATTGCAACRGTRCAACDPQAAARKIERDQREQMVIDPMLLPVLTPLSDWTPHYFESLHEVHGDCQRRAEAALTLLGPGTINLHTISTTEGRVWRGRW